MKQPTAASLSILRFWRDLEIFNIPTAPSAKDATEQTKIITLRPGETLPWERAEFKPSEQYGYVHVVYVGVADTEDLARLLLQAVFPDQDLSERERQRASGNGWLAAFVATENGSPKLDSYLASSFAHGVDALWHSESLENINARLERAREEFTQRRHKLAQPEADAAGAQALPSPLTWNDLEEELRIVRNLLGKGAEATGIDWRVVIRASRVKRSYLDDNLEAATDYLNSFYLDDLDRLISQTMKNKPFGKALNAYLGTPVDEAQRIDILEQHASMGKLVSVARLPSARWPAPAKYPLVLAQQAAVAQILHALGCEGGGTIGVNGPPGTGKTTLLCDVIAEVVTDRARRIAALGKPSELFEDKIEIAGKSFFPLKARVMAGTSIVVSSTNNNAVKNITQELPAREKVSGEFGPAAYFEEVIREVFAAQKVVDKDGQPVECWGLIAAALGNAGNRRAFAKGLFRYDPKPRGAAGQTETTSEEVEEDDQALQDSAGDAPPDALPPSMKQLLEAATKEYARYQVEWQVARKVFRAPRKTSIRPPLIKSHRSEFAPSQLR
ncbi:MAG: hypothetical protein L6Q40_11845 [Azonexus sp.]|nr:hypothetical protein [Azonexus sp.]